MAAATQGAPRADERESAHGTFRRALFALCWWALGVGFVVAPWVPVVCPLRLTTGIPCPSCGLTRAARDVLHGDLAAATHVHPLWWLVLPYVGAVVVLETVSYIRTGRAGDWGRHPVVKRLGAGILVAMVLVWAARGVGAFGGPVLVD